MKEKIKKFLKTLEIYFNNPNLRLLAIFLLLVLGFNVIMFVLTGHVVAVLGEDDPPPLAPYNNTGGSP